MMKTNITIGLILMVIVNMVFTLPNVSSSDNVIVIVNPDAPASSLTKAEVKNIFLAKKTQWENGRKINFVTLKNGPTHDVFLKEYLGKSSSQFNRYFRTLVFTGKGSLPKSFEDEKALVNYVASTEGAIGYVSMGTGTDSTKIITIN